MYEELVLDEKGRNVEKIIERMKPASVSPKIKDEGTSGKECNSQVERLWSRDKETNE